MDKLMNSCCCGSQAERESGLRVKIESAVETERQKQSGELVHAASHKWAGG